jgi:hypothetical protein
MRSTPINVAMIRQTYMIGLDVTDARPPGPEEEELLRCRLVRYVQFLIEEVKRRAARVTGELRSLAVHVSRLAQRVLTEGAGPTLNAQANFVQDLAGITRALLALDERLPPITSSSEPAGGSRAESACRG